LAVAGLQETLEALANGQVDELLTRGALEKSHPLLEEVESATGKVRMYLWLLEQDSYTQAVVS
jgi:hypothetical protein